MKNTQTLQHAMRLAGLTQGYYNALKSPSTQRVRNPFPLRELVQEALPALPNPRSVVETKVTTQCTVNGKKFVQSQMKGITAFEALGGNWYIVNPCAVRCTINNNRRAGMVQRVRLPKETGQIGRGRVNYFKIA